MNIEYIIRNQERLIKEIEKGIKPEITFDYATLILNALLYQKQELEHRKCCGNCYNTIFGKCMVNAEKLITGHCVAWKGSEGL